MRNFYITQMTPLPIRPSPNELPRFEECVGPAARLLKLLASEQRLLLLCRLLEGEASVGELADYAKLAQSAASQHLSKMRAEGLVATRREAQTIYYRLDNVAVVRVLDILRELYRDPSRARAEGYGI